MSSTQGRINSKKYLITSDSFTYKPPLPPKNSHISTILPPSKPVPSIPSSVYSSENASIDLFLKFSHA